jgi:hypothetical protein
MSVRDAASKTYICSDSNYKPPTDAERRKSREESINLERRRAVWTFWGRTVYGWVKSAGYLLSCNGSCGYPSAGDDRCDVCKTTTCGNDPEKCAAKLQEFWSKPPTDDLSKNYMIYNHRLELLTESIEENCEAVEENVEKLIVARKCILRLEAWKRLELVVAASSPEELEEVAKKFALLKSLDRDATDDPEPA